VRVYEKVRVYLDEHCLKQAAVAKKAGISKTTFSAMMNGKRTMYADDLESICHALNVSSVVFIEPKTA
jgi:transcriptional regulator with XRE-family HTH domain